MKTVDKKEVVHSQSPEFIKQAEEGKFLKLIPDTFVIKLADGAQGYAIRHLNRQDLILIDTLGKGAQAGVKQLVEEGYKIKGILVTNNEVLNNTYASISTISEDAGGAPIYTHPVNKSDENFSFKNITGKEELFDKFSISVRDFPAKSGESVVIHSEINGGMVFAGNTAVGADYDAKENDIKRPDIGSENKNFSLAESWRSYMHDFRYFFPYKGQPAFKLSEGQQKDIILKLGTTDYPGGGNPNL